MFDAPLAIAGEWLYVSMSAKREEIVAIMM
jgi:hypothetical protein